MSAALEERTHHSYSPSSLESLECCPCFINRQSDTPHERTVAGTKAHNVVDSRTDDATLSDEDAEAAAECMDLVGQSKKAMEEAWERDFPSDPNKWTAERVLEIREDYWPIDREVFSDAVATTAGYSDTVLVSHCRTKAEVWDWKFGRWPVTDAKENLQGIAYALGVFHRFPTVQEVQVFFIQPLLEHKTNAVFKRSDVSALELRVKIVVARAREARRTGDFLTANPTVPVCGFCGNLGKCPKVAAFACKVGHKYYPLEIPEDITPTAIHDAKNTSLAMRLAFVVKNWAEAFRTQVTDRVLAMRADLPEGFKIESRAGREIVDMAKLKEIALTHLTEPEYETTLSTTFGALEEFVSDKAPRGSKKKALEDFKAQLEAAGAVKRGEAYHFLKAIPASKKDKEQ